MSDHENIALMRKVYDAFGVGDVQTAGSYWTEDAVHHYPGRSPLSGEHHGLQESIAFAEQMFELTGGNLRMDVLEIGASDNHAFALLHTHYERKGRVLEMPFVNVARIEGGKIAEFWTYPNDLYAIDEFWNA
ncbi:nuclear transport factor 2 family protein [Amycolatopsis sp. NBC_00345]|uniref:nuclear transport factor 2 family protein n=1 Tax=Amycolatopsis sp. NBC_00345 TaxID=2975955 RepID=UPI002E25CF05